MARRSLAERFAPAIKCRDPVAAVKCFVADRIRRRREEEVGRPARIRGRRRTSSRLRAHAVRARRRTLFTAEAMGRCRVRVVVLGVVLAQQIVPVIVAVRRAHDRVDVAPASARRCRRRRRAGDRTRSGSPGSECDSRTGSCRRTCPIQPKYVSARCARTSSIRIASCPGSNPPDVDADDVEQQLALRGGQVGASGCRRTADPEVVELRDREHVTRDRGADRRPRPLLGRERLHQREAGRRFGIEHARTGVFPGRRLDRLRAAEVRGEHELVARGRSS